MSLMTRHTAEEKIVQIGRQKMALDHALIESIDIEDADEVDVESILKHGAKALFDTDDQSQTKNYNPKEVDELLDRSQVESEKVEKQNGTSTQFSSARIWVSDKSTLTEDMGESNTDAADDKALKDLFKAAREEASRQSAMAQDLGRLRERKDNKKPLYRDSRADIEDYGLGGDNSPVKTFGNRKKRKSHESDDEFVEAAGAAGAADDEEDEVGQDNFDPGELGPSQPAGRSRSEFIGTTGKPNLKFISKPPRPATSGKTPRGGTLVLSSSAKPAKVQLRIKDSKGASASKTAVVGAGSLPIMGHAVKECNAAVTKESIDKKQRAQTEESVRHVDLNTKGSVPEAHINTVSARANGMNRGSTGGKQLTKLNGLSVKPPGTQLPVASTESSDRLSQYPLRTQDKATDKESSHEILQQKANATIKQTRQPRDQSMTDQQKLPPPQNRKLPSLPTHNTQLNPRGPSPDLRDRILLDISHPQSSRHPAKVKHHTPTLLTLDNPTSDQQLVPPEIRLPSTSHNFTERPTATLCNKASPHRNAPSNHSRSETRLLDGSNNEPAPDSSLTQVLSSNIGTEIEQSDLTIPEPMSPASQSSSPIETVSVMFHAEMEEMAERDHKIVDLKA